MAKEKERNLKTVKSESNAHERDVARSKDDDSSSTPEANNTESSKSSSDKPKDDKDAKDLPNELEYKGTL